jgi:serine/threonine protein kinase
MKPCESSLTTATVSSRPSEVGGWVESTWLTTDEVLDRDMAIKILDPLHAEQPQVVERFKREAKSAASLSHPNIVTVHDWGRTEDGTYFMAMEYVVGK